MTKIAIYGAGGLGHEVAANIRAGLFVIPNGNRISYVTTEDIDLIGYFDDRDFSFDGDDRLLGPWLGGIDVLNSWKEELGVILCFGHPATRLAVAKRITNPLISFPNTIHKDFVMSDVESFKIGWGNVIQGGCVATTDVMLGDFNLLNGSVVLAHNDIIGDGNVFNPGVRISGDVKIGNGNVFGAMSFVKQGLKIGNNVTLSPLSALLTKPKDGRTYIGNPAKVFKF